VTLQERFIMIEQTPKITRICHASGMGQARSDLGYSLALKETRSPSPRTSSNSIEDTLLPDGQGFCQRGEIVKILVNDETTEKTVMQKVEKAGRSCAPGQGHAHRQCGCLDTGLRPDIPAAQMKRTARRGIKWHFNAWGGK